MAVSGTKVYVGGGFSGIDGIGRKNLAAFDFSGNLDAQWRPKTDKVVRGLDFSCDGTTIFATGSFRNAAGTTGVFAPREQVARFNTATGSLHPWAIPAGTVENGEIGSDLAVTCERVTVPFLGPNHLRSFRLDDGDKGTVAWDIKAGGDPQTVAMLGDDKLIVGGHFGQIQGGKRARIAQLNLSDGKLDPWNPGITGKAGAATIGPWDLLVDGNHLYIGGGFWEVAGLERTFLTRFTFS
jgi:trimeric autotransporter adhesin